MNNPNNQNTRPAGAPNERPPIIDENVKHERRAVLGVLSFGAVALALHLYKTFSGGSASSSISVSDIEKSKKRFYTKDEIPEEMVAQWNAAKMKAVKEAFEADPTAVYDLHTGNVVLSQHHRHYLGSTDSQRLTKADICIPEGNETPKSFQLMKEAAESLIAANRQAITTQGLGICIPIKSMFRSNAGQKRMYEENQKRSFFKRVIVGEMVGAHGLGQAIDVDLGRLSKENYKKIRAILHQHGWMDNEEADCGHFEYRKAGLFTENDKSKSNINTLACSKDWAKAFVKYTRKPRRWIGKGIRKVRNWFK